MGGGGDKDVHGSSPRLAPSSYDVMSKRSIGAGHGVINGKSVEPLLDLGKTVQPSLPKLS